MAYNGYMLKDAVEATRNNLEHRNGAYYITGTDELFNGFAYSTMCGGECGLPGMPALSWYGEFKNGLKDGVFYRSASGSFNESFFLEIFGCHRVNHYSLGKEISHNKALKTLTLFAGTSNRWRVWKPLS